MSLIVTPRQLSLRAELYHQFAQLANAGISLLQALETLRRSPPARAFREPLGRIHSRIEQGSTFSEAVRTTGHWIPSFDLALIEAGEKSGRLPSCFTLLANYYAERSRLVRDVIRDLMYPVFLLHAAVFIMPFPQLFLTGNLVGYLSQTLGILLPIYLAVFLVIFACQGRHGERWRATLEHLTRFIPLLGTARRDLALARLTAALEALISAGVNIIEAWEMAAGACGSPRIRRAVLAWRTELDMGETPSRVIEKSGVFPDLFSTMYHTGEISGQLDDTLRRLHGLYQDSASRKLHAVSEWGPRLIYILVVISIAIQIVSFWVGHYNQIGEVLP